MFGAFAPSDTFRFAALFVLFLGAFALLGSRYGDGLRCAFLRFRIPIGVVVVILATALEISGSSIAWWGPQLGESSFIGTLFGIPRPVRSDEFLVSTPFAVSQGQIGYPAVSTLIRGSQTDVTMVYAQPCWSFSTLFRPFLWGYLLLGPARGLSFFWSARLVALALVSFEMAYRLTRGRASAALFYSLTISFSPLVQWWFAVNGIAELFVFGQGLVLALRGLCDEGSARRRWALALLIAWMATSFLLVVYPPWQVPLFWTFAATGIGWAVQYVRESKQEGVGSRIVGPLVASAGLVALCSALSFLPAIDAMMLQAGTVYPGQRANTGGELAAGGLTSLSLVGALNALRASEVPVNASEATALLPISGFGLLIGLVSLAASKRRGGRVDWCVVLLCAVELVLALYSAVGLPEPLAAITMLSRSTSARVWQVIGIIDLIIVMRLLGRSDGPSLARRRLPAHATGGKLGLGPRPIVVAAFVLVGTVLVVHLVLKARALTGLRLSMCAFVTIQVLALGLALASSLVLGADRALVAVAFVTLVSGCCVNPVQRGTDALTNSRAYIAIGEIAASDDDALWAADSSTYGQLCIAAGGPCINSVCVYPDIDRWRIIDEERLYEDVYNRFAHASIDVRQVAEPSFSLLTPDSFSVTLSPADLAALGVEYFVSLRTDLDAMRYDGWGFMRVGEAGSAVIWRLVPV